jgi:ferritin-like metal-binding protein YciE
MTAPGEHLMHWLRDAHAMEKQAIESVENQIDRLRNYPELRNWAQDHVQAAKQHRELIRQCIERRGGSPSTIKDVAMAVVGPMQQCPKRPLHREGSRRRQPHTARLSGLRL